MRDSRIPGLFCSLVGVTKTPETSHLELSQIIDKTRIIDFIRRKYVAQLKTDVEKLYAALSVGGENGLSRWCYRFDVGATKIMNFLFPDLFVIVDRYVKKAVHSSGELYFGKYWDIMMICRGELREWEQHHGNLDSLLRLDTKPTTETRIFDKCAFVIGKFGG